MKAMCLFLLFLYLWNMWTLKFGPTNLLGHPHAEDAGHALYEDAADPGGHAVGARLAVVEVEDDGGEADGHRHQHHREQEVAPQQRQRQARGRDHLKHGGQALPHPQ